ncbi:MAG TPA: lamin tail domain-containing protein, partial [Archangium sp.]|nr:lamin tail domain-containing protein [Archangium sp.]
STDRGVLDVAGTGKVVIPAGQTSAEVKLIPRAQSPGVKLTASLRGVTLETTVRVLAINEAATLEALTPDPVVTAPGFDATLTATLDIPAPEGTSVDVTVTPATLGTVTPSTVAVTPDASSVRISFLANPDAALTDTGTITVKLGTSEVSTQVSFTDDFPKVESITPTPVTVFQGTTRTFTVTLNKVAEGDMVVKLAAVPPTDSTPFGTFPDTMVVPAGSRSGTFVFTADAAGNGTGIVRATLGTSKAEASVFVRAPYPKLVSISPATAKLVPHASRKFTVTLDKNAEAGGFTVMLALSPPAIGSVPATVTIPVDTKTAEVTFKAGPDERTGTLTASNDLAPGSSVSAGLVVESLPPHVVISEFAPQGTGPTGTVATNEFIELYNPTNAEVDLAGWVVQYKSATGTSYSSSFPLPAGAKIASRGYYLVVAGGYLGAVAGDANYGTTFGMAAGATGGGHVRLGKPGTTSAINDELVVDTVGYGSGNSPEGVAITPMAAVAGSFERKAFVTSTLESMATGADAAKGNGYDSDDNSVDFLLRATRDPQNSASPTETP